MNKKWTLILGTASILLAELIISIIKKDPFALIKITYHELTTILSKQYIISMWGLILVAIAPLCLVIILRAIALSRGSGNPKTLSMVGPPWNKYVSALIDSVEWHWKYYDDGSIDGYCLHPLCPSCKGELILINRSSMLGVMEDDNRLECENCNTSLKIDLSFSDYFEKIAREIRRRIRTGEYKESLKYG